MAWTRLVTRAWGVGVLFGGASALGQGVTYTDVAFEAGLRTAHQPSANFLLSGLNLANFTAGGAVADFNNDGWMDIYVISGGGVRDQLYINNGNGTFTDRASEWGITALHMGLGAAIGDYNNDGWVDLYVTSIGPANATPIVGAHRLYRNNGNSTFTSVGSSARVNRTSTVLPDGLGACFGDYDLDGDLDLCVVGWITGSGGNRLFRNNGNGLFSDVTVASGFHDLAVRGYSPRIVDMNGDRLPEILVAGDFGTSRYFANLGSGAFANRTVESGTGLDANGMGSAIGDFNGDGRLDWYVTSIYTLHPISGVPGTGNKLYLGVGAHQFVESATPAGVNQGGWGWGTQGVDIDHDGNEDIVATNGWGQANGAGDPEWLFDPTCAFRSLGDGTFVSCGDATGLASHTGQGRGLAILDYDNDGDEDVLILTFQGVPRLFRSNLVTGGVTPSDAHWVRVLLDTSRSRGRVAPQGYGAKVEVTTGGKSARTQYRAISPGSTFLCSSEASAHFGLGTATRAAITVRWPDGRVTTLADRAADATMTVRYCVSDFNGNGSADSGDFFEFLVAFFSSDLAADVDRSGGVTSADFFDFLVLFFEGC
jgi:hypothetical protein